MATRRGRHQVYRLAGPAVAAAIESLAAVSPVITGQHPSDPFRSERMHQLRAARTCYDHLAGVAGVLLHGSLISLGYLKPNGPGDYALTAKGHEWFAKLGAYCAENPRSRAGAWIGPSANPILQAGWPHSCSIGSLRMDGSRESAIHGPFESLNEAGGRLSGSTGSI